MKKIEDIEKLDLQELETIAEDKKAAVPEGLNASVERVIEAQALREQIESKRHEARFWRPLSISLAAVAVCLTVVFTLPKKQAALQDTFDDPMLAYAEVQQVFNKLSTKMEHSITLAANSRAELSANINNAYKSTNKTK